MSDDPERLARQREGRSLCAGRGPWRRWVREPTPCAPDGSTPDVLDEAALQRGRARQRQVERWIEEGGDLPWDP